MNIIKLTLDTLTTAVFEQIVAIEASCGLSCYYPPEVLRECIRIGDTYACMDGENVAGFITIDKDATDYFDLSLHIANINVTAAYRRQGIAQRMIRTTCRYYTQSHAGLMVTLDVEKTNTAARNLYEKLGFSVSDMASENGEDDLVMTIPLKQLIS